MRLIGWLDDEKKAYQFSTFLEKEGIESSYEFYVDPQTKEKQYRIWVDNEDDLNNALDFFEEFKARPSDPKFQEGPIRKVYERPEAQSPERPFGKVKLEIRPKMPGFSFTMTNFFIIICSVLFIWNNYFQEMTLMEKEGPVSVQLGMMTPIQKAFLFDYPETAEAMDKFVGTYDLKSFKNVNELPETCKELYMAANKTPTWNGVYELIVNSQERTKEYLKEVTLFQKIREGEFWRLFTPCLLHYDLLHILFNMAWVWMLGKQIENRLGGGKLLIFALITGIFSNVCQYFMSGPYFLGFSGIVVAMAGFIWMRQKIAPWEGYPLQKGTALFIFYFVLAMLALSFISFFLQVTSLMNFSPIIANTAHIAGGLCGMLLARIPFFARKV